MQVPPGCRLLGKLLGGGGCGEQTELMGFLRCPCPSAHSLADGAEQG